MNTQEVEVQPVQGPSTDDAELDLSSDEAIPEHKSGVYVDPNAPNQSGRYGKRDTVHMSITQSGVRTKGTFKVAKGRLHSSGGYWEYQLVDGLGNAYKNGAWIREKDLKLEKKG